MRNGPKILLLSFFLAILAVFSALVLSALRHPENPSPSIAEFKSDPITGYEYLPSSHFSYVEKGRRSKIIDVYHDKYGARVFSPNTVSSTPSTIMIIGGSQAMGQGVLAEETFSGILAKNLHTSVVNLAVSGYGGTGSLLQLKRYINTFRPKYIVYAFWQDHLNRNVNPCLENSLPVCEKRPTVTIGKHNKLTLIPAGDNQKSIQLVNEWYTTTHPNFWFNLKWKWQRLKWKFLEMVHRSPEDNPLQTDADKQAATTYVLEQMEQVAKKHNAKLIVVFIPYYTYTTQFSMPPYINQIAKNNQITLINMGPTLFNMFNNHVDVMIPDDGHITPQVHSTIAQKIITEIRR